MDKIFRNYLNLKKLISLKFLQREKLVFNFLQKKIKYILFHNFKKFVFEEIYTLYCSGQFCNNNFISSKVKF